MRSLFVATVVALLVAGPALGLSVVSYKLQVGGDNRDGGCPDCTGLTEPECVALCDDPGGWEAGGNPAFVPPAWGDASPPAPIVINADEGDLVTWDAIIEVTGLHSGDVGNGQETNGIANFVFDLQLFEGDGAGSPNLAAPVTEAGIFESTINDGDNDGVRQIFGGEPTDPLEAAAFCLAFSIDSEGFTDPMGLPTLDNYNMPAGLGTGPPLNPGRVFDKGTAGGPHLDRAQFPTTDDRAGCWWADDVYCDGVQSGNAGTPAAGLEGQLKGMGAGYSAYGSVLIDGLATGDAAGLGIDTNPGGGWPGLLAAANGTYRGLQAGVAGDPSVEMPVVEGQMDLSGLTTGEYCLVLTAEAEGHNVIPGSYEVMFTSGGAFAVQANDAVGDEICFEIEVIGGGGIVDQAWASRRSHAGGTLDLDIPLDPALATGGVETRQNGVQLVVVTYDGAPTLGAGLPTATPLPAGAPIAADAVAVNGNDLEITFNAGTLPDEACYLIDVSPAVTNLDAAANATCTVLALQGNTNGDTNTNLIDMSQVKSEGGSNPADPGKARFDVNLDGNINLIDMSLVKSLGGGAAGCP